MIDIEKKEVLLEFKKEFDKAVPASTRKVLFELMGNPDWLEISETLYHIPPARPVGRDELFSAMKDYIAENDIGYYRLNESLMELKKKGYIRIRKGSENFFLTKKSAAAIEVFNTFRKEIVEPIVTELRQRSECRNVKGLDRLIISEIHNSYSKVSAERPP